MEALDGREAKCALERFQRHTAERRQRMRGHVSHVGRDSARERGSERAAASRSGRGTHRDDASGNVMLEYSLKTGTPSTQQTGTTVKVFLTIEE